MISYGEAAAGRTEFAIDVLHDGRRLGLGDVTLEIRATPGHTPESISVVVFETAEGTSADGLARQLYHSLNDRLLTLPDGRRPRPQAVHIPLGDLDRRTGELPADRPVVCICRSGARSLCAAELLTGHGLDVHNLNGEMRAWSDAELAVVTSERTPGQVI